MPRFDRYRLYYHLIDISFALQAAFIITEVTEAIVGRRIIWGAWQPLGIGLLCFALIVPAILVFMRSMRDEFTETLWRATAGTALKALIILPIPVALLTVAYSAASTASGGALAPPSFNTVATSKLFGMAITIVTLWLITPVIFTFAFQWHRWRGSR